MRIHGLIGDVLASDDKRRMKDLIRLMRDHTIAVEGRAQALMDITGPYTLKRLDDEKEYEIEMARAALSSTLWRIP